jgi:Protein of unknown function (DUF3830)
VSLRIRLSFTQDNVSAEAELLMEEAPATCQALLRLLPLAGVSHHAIYSGSECVLLLDQVLRLPAENATTKVTRGEVAFTWMAAGSKYGVHSDFSEICWFYDIDAEPRMWEGPTPVNVFARIVEPADSFYAVCRRMRREGVKPLAVLAC